MAKHSNIWEQVEKPTLLLDRARVITNIHKMAARAQTAGVAFRPHFKTHQSAKVGEWFYEAGVRAITVSSVDMARYFAGHGWRDITLAFPVNLRQVAAINELAHRLRLNVLLESADVARQLGRQLSAEVNVWLKVDVGYHRTGLPWDDATALTTVAWAVHETPHLKLQGILTHDGRTYAADSPDKVRTLYGQALRRLQAAQQTLRGHGWQAAISVGDTPACSLVESFGPVDEIRPGNFVFYDLMQLNIGACRQEEIAVAVACPVVARHPARHRLILYGGAVHLSKDSLREPGGRPIYGRVVRPEGHGWSPIVPGAAVVGLSQEHGLVEAPPELLETVKEGDLLGILPVHSCLTANLLGRYLTLDGEWLDMARF